jgi:hypothetical protein
VPVNKPFDETRWFEGSVREETWCGLMLCFEPLCLSTQVVISLSVKTLLNHVGSALFLLKSARLLSKSRHAEFLALELAFLCLSAQSVIF